PTLKYPAHTRLTNARAKYGLSGRRSQVIKIPRRSSGASRASWASPSNLGWMLLFAGVFLATDFRRPLILPLSPGWPMYTSGLGMIFPSRARRYSAPSLLPFWAAELGF